MKSILIIGAGNFGHYLCRDLAALQNEIMIIDKNENALEDLLDVATDSMIADCTRESVLKRLGVSNFDMCFVCLNEASANFQTCLEVTSLLKDLGANYIVSLAENAVDEKFLLRNGADEVIRPNKDSAIRAAVKYNNDNIFDYIDLKDGYSIYEITPLSQWVDKSILDSNIRVNYNVYIIGIVHTNGSTDFMPDPKTVIHADDHLLTLSHENTMNALMPKM